VGAAATQTEATPIDRVSVERLFERIPDGFLVLDQDGLIVQANQAFLDLIQAGGKAPVVGERIGRWLGRPGADLTVLMANIQRHGVVKLFSTVLHGELGTETEVEISAVGDAGTKPQHVFVLLRDVASGCRMPTGATAWTRWWARSPGRSAEPRCASWCETPWASSSGTTS